MAHGAGRTLLAVSIQMGRLDDGPIVRGVVRESRPDLVIAVDALAARNVHRLASTIQLTDTGIIRKAASATTAGE